MLSPATPLTIAFFIAFVLLLLATLSTPVIPAIPLGTYHDYHLGVFGYCHISNSTCSSAKVGYNPATLGTGVGDSPANISSGTRTTLTYILIIHPIAAFLVFICFILAAAAHLPGPGHSSRYLLGLLILTFPTLLVTLLAFLVDILLFIPPHMGWGGWILLPATLIITACSVVTCAMRRTLVSRKARKERIEKNEDMNGSTYYAMKQETQFRPPQPSFARAESPPPLPSDGSIMSGATDREKTAQFDAYEYGGSRSFDANRANNTDAAGHPGGMSGTAMFGGAAAAGALGAAGAMAARDDLPSPMGYEDRTTPRGSFDRSRSATNGGPDYRRGGPPPQFYSRGRGGPPRGPPRGGYYPPSRGSFGRGGGPRGPPPPGWNGGYGRGGPGTMRGRGRPGPPPGYPSPYYGEPSPPPHSPDGAMMYPARGGSFSGRSSSDRARAQMPAQGNDYQAAEADWDLNDTQIVSSDQQAPASPYRERSGSQGRDTAAPMYDNRPSSSDRRPSTGDSRTRDPASFGFSGRVPSPARSQRSGYRGPTPPPPVPPVSYQPPMPAQPFEMDTNTNNAEPFARDQGSVPYDGQSGGAYPAQQDWQTQPAELGNRTPTPRYESPRGFAAPAEPGSPAARSTHSRPQTPRHRGQGSKDAYYEDMDPRFSEDTARPQYNPESHEPLAPSPQEPVPSSLMPGGGLGPTYGHPSNPSSTYPSGMTDPHDDSRSPALSEDEGSNFTSISQRGINPEWQPAHGWSGNVGSYGPAPAQRGMDPNWRDREREQILNNNPDFTVPGAGPRAGRASMGAGHARGLSAGAGASHRYPDPV